MTDDRPTRVPDPDAHAARLVSNNRLLQNAALALAASETAIDLALRRLSKRADELFALPEPDPPPVLPDPLPDDSPARRDILCRTRERVAQSRLLRQEQGKRKRRSARQLVHMMLRDGRLPSDGVSAIVRSSGAAEKCDLCGSRLTRELPIMEIQIDGGSRTANLHADCFALWDSERHRGRV